MAELPSSTQVRLLRVLESGEFLRVGSSKVHKTNVRVVAATNVNIPNAIQEGKFREDLYYRLNTVPIQIPPLRDRENDIPLLFRKFAADFADKYHMPPISINDDARRMLISYKWPGNIRQLKNITEQISIIEESRSVTPEVLLRYLPDYSSVKLPALLGNKGFVDEQTFATEREILYKILFDMRNDVNELKKLVLDLMRNNPENIEFKNETAKVLNNLYNSSDKIITPVSVQVDSKPYNQNQVHIQDTEEIVEESLSLSSKDNDSSTISSVS